MQSRPNAMRQPSDNCLLCNENKASKKSSHIIPKFFGHGLFYGSKPRHSILWYKSGKREKIQDIMKEDYLFCPECEKGFSVLETYCSLRLERFNDLRYHNNFKRFKYGDFEFIESKEIDKRIFNLFIYSIVWRVSISDKYGFLSFKLPDCEEEKLKLILKEFSKPTQAELMDQLDKLQNLPDHSHVIIRPNKKLRPPASMLSAASYNDWMHQIHLVDYVLLYLTDRGKLIERLREIDNNGLNNLVRIGLTDKSSWETFNFNMIKKATKK